MTEIEQLAEELARRIHAPQVEPLLTAADIAAILGVCQRQVSDRYAMMPSFPKAIRLPTPTGKNAERRWKKSEVLEWIDGLREAA